MKWIEESIETALKDANPTTRLIIADVYNDRRRIFYTIVVMLLLMILSSAFTSKLFCYLKLDVLILQLKNNPNLAVALIIIYVLFVIYKVIYFRLFREALLPTISSVIRLVGALLLYFCFLKVQFEPFMQFGYYSDIIVLLSSSFLLDFKPYKQQPEQKVGDGFYSDSFDINSDNDTLSRIHVASEIANTINETYSKKSFAIGVIGEWGYGKTTFIEFILSKLRKKRENVIIKFHPWKPNDKPEIIREFYSQLINEVEKFDSKLSRSITLYADKLVGEGSENVGIIKSVIANISGNNNSIEYYFNAVEKAIESSGRKFIIYIDDLDRLSGEEILEVLKIIRGTAQLPNFFFIGGFDVSYVKDVLVKSNSIAHEHSFLRKIFQLEFILPPITKNNIIERVDEIVNNDNVLKLHSKNITSTFNNLFDLSVAKAFARVNGESFNYEGIVVRTYRDVIRILNSLKISMQIIGKYIVVRDLVIVEVIKNLFPEVYLELSIGKRLFKIVTNTDRDEKGKVTVDEERVKQVVSRVNGTNKIYDENLIISLLNGTSLDSQIEEQVREGRYPLAFEENHIIYFNYLGQGHLLEDDFKEFYEATLDQRIEIIKAYLEANKILFINQLFEREQPPLSLKAFKNQLLTQLYYLDLLDSINMNRISELLNNYVEGKGKEEVEELVNFIFELTDDTKISLLVRSSFNHEILYQLIKGNTTISLYFDIDKVIPKLKDNAYSILKEHLTSTDKINYHTYRVYYNNLEKIIDNRIILTKEANEMFRSFIENHKRDYIALQLRPLYTPPDNYYTFEPFIPQIFEEENDKQYEKFGQFLKDALENEELSDLRFIGDIFLRFKYSGFNRVELNSSEIALVNKIQEPYLTKS